MAHLSSFSFWPLDLLHPASAAARHTRHTPNLRSPAISRDDGPLLRWAMGLTIPG